MESLLRDLRFGSKVLWRDRGFAATVIVTLALAIGANVAMWSVVDSVLLAPLPFPESDRFVNLLNSYPNAGADRASTAVPDYFDRLEHVPALDRMAIWRVEGYTLGEGATPEQLAGCRATASLLATLGVEPALGRLFTTADEVPGEDTKVILTDGLYQQLGGRPEILGQDVRLSGKPYEVVGVLPAGFTFLDQDVRLWTPAAFDAEARSDDRRHSNNWQMIGRLAPGATVAQAQSQLDALNAANLDRFPHLRELLIDAGFHSLALPFKDDLVRKVKAPLFLLWGGVGFVLLIAAVNVANLTMVRGTARLRELSIRTALGAGRDRLVRQLITEGVLLAFAGGAAGLALAAAALAAFAHLGLDQLPRSFEIGVDAGTFVVTALLAAALALLLGLLPLSQLSAHDPYAALREEGRSGTASRNTRRFGRALVVAQVAFACLLLVGAGLLLASFQKVVAVDPGFRSEGVLTASVSLPRARYPEDADQRAFASRLLGRIAGLPGVERFGVTSSVPFGNDFSDSVIFAEGYVMAPGESVISPTASVVSPGYFETLGIPLIAGRTFDASDVPGARRAVIVDERLARRFWGKENPIGRRMYSPSNVNNLLDPGPEESRFTVVGVVAEIKMKTRVQDSEPVGAYYFPFAQQPDPSFSLVLATSGPFATLADAVRRETALVDPELAMFAVRPLEELLAEDLVPRKGPMVLALLFAGVALTLSAVGLYGTLAYSVAQRTRELGVRMALGGDRPRILKLVLGEGLGMFAAGLAVGLGGAVAFGRALESQLYGVTPLDAGVLGLVTLVLAAVSLLACFVPALRATRVDPVTALGMD